MTAATQTDPPFVLGDPSQGAPLEPAVVPGHPAGPLGPLAELPGTWRPGRTRHAPLQYSRLVALDFNGLRRPPVTVATLHNQP